MCQKQAKQQHYPIALVAPAYGGVKGGRMYAILRMCFCHVPKPVKRQY